MMRVAVVMLAFVAGCASEAEDRWRYESVLWEHEPSITSAGDARTSRDRIAAQSELTLEDCWRLAVYRTETLALQGEELVRLQTQYEQAVGAILPRLNFKATYTRQEESSSGGASGFSSPQRTQYSFALKQPIFSGLRELHAMRVNRALHGAREDDLRHARGRLLADVADAFFAVLQVDREQATVRDALKLAEERLQELAERQKVGMSRRSEVLAQEAEVAATRAALERLQGVLVVAWEALQFVTGVAMPHKLADTLPEPHALDPVERYLERAMQNRRDLRSLQAQLKAADESIGVARAGYFPTVTLDANYFLHRPGSGDDVNWEAIIAADVPLFDGMTTQAKVREATSNVRSAQLRLDAQTRQIRLAISRAHTAVETLRIALGSIEKQVASAQENYDLVQAEYRQGLVTNVEVLTSFNTLQRARLDRDRARYDIRFAAVILEVEIGVEPGGAR